MDLLEKIEKSMKSIIRKEALPVGAVSQRSDGNYKKVAPGKWERVPENTKNFEKKVDTDIRQSKRRENDIKNAREIITEKIRAGTIVKKPNDIGQFLRRAYSNLKREDINDIIQEFTKEDK